jgi:hypothetical protein
MVTATYSDTAMEVDEISDELLESLVLLLEKVRLELERVIACTA